MISYELNLFAILIIYLMRIASINCQQQQFLYPERAIHPSDEILRPIWKFSSFFQGQVEYQCYQKCLPIIPSQPEMLYDLCNKVCPFKPSIPECAKCAQIYSQVAGETFPNTDDNIGKRTISQPETIAVEPKSHAIMFTPEVIVMGYERKQCCYMDQCSFVPISASCEPRCYEPCDSVCTGRCLVNPQCPNDCEKVRLEQYKLQYRIWLSQKLNEIKKKYRAMATACLLKTRLSFVGEVQNYYQMARHAIENIPSMSRMLDENNDDENNDENNDNEYENLDDPNLHQ
ncbi:hypothetical protein PVAND_000527 [Polypedilum vanderplanki]|uniref:Uncharacterized protein n=1 Tax=Polypedilum vanderplanki TaxID=319348 RepID=A0A9J6BKG6_POLVA|nr:hypothetical protein PVAND_000527 [Polypedilum vanderplanki]